MKKVILLLAVIATSCNLLPEPELAYDPGLALLVDRFYADAEAHGRHLDRGHLVIGFADLRPDLGGDSNRKGTVRINSRYKNRHDLQWIVYHELGHALLHRGHTPGNTSIMASREWNNGNISQSLIDELFTE